MTSKHFKEGGDHFTWNAEAGYKVHKGSAPILVSNVRR